MRVEQWGKSDERSPLLGVSEFVKHTEMYVLATDIVKRVDVLRSYTHSGKYYLNHWVSGKYWL